MLIVARLARPLKVAPAPWRSTVAESVEIVVLRFNVLLAPTTQLPVPSVPPDTMPLFATLSVPLSASTVPLELLRL